MSQVYSVQLAAQISYHGALIILVPTGFKLVVRDIDGVRASDPSGGSLQFLGNIGQLLWIHNYAVNTFDYASWRGRQVFEPGQSFQIVSGAAVGTPGWSFQVSGYKLALP